jgi:hypothetical protein
MGRMTGRPETIICLRRTLARGTDRELTKAPATVKGVDELVAKQYAEYPDGPACNVGDSAKDPVTTRTGYSGGVGIRKLCYSSDLN